MAKGSSGGGLLVVVAGLVLIAAIPTEIWIALAALALLGVAIYYAPRIWNSRPKRALRSASQARELTLAELTAKNAVSSPRRRPPAGLTMTIRQAQSQALPLAEEILRPESLSRPTALAADALGQKTTVGEDESVAHRSLSAALRARGQQLSRERVVSANRQRAEEARAAHPQRVSVSLVPTPASKSTHLHSESRSVNELSDVALAQTEPDRLYTADTDAARRAMSTWELAREKAARLNRQRAAELRAKLPVVPIMATRSAAPPIKANQPPALPPERLRAAVATSDLREETAIKPHADNGSSAGLSLRGALASIRSALGPSVVSDRAPDAETLYTAKPSAPAPPSFALPKPPPGLAQTRWFGPGDAVSVAGFDIPDGMLYVGTRLRAPNGGIEPALIDPTLRVARKWGNANTFYWPSYDELTPEYRFSYLDWLASGRSDPESDISFVLLFFFGIERRVLLDGRDDPSTKSEWPALLAELRRLIQIYGERSDHFTRHAAELLSWMELDSRPARLYAEPVPEFPRTYEVPHYLRLALGQASVDRQPIPPLLALAWLRLSPDVYLRTAATRCPAEFTSLFELRYTERMGVGLVLSKNRTKLKMVYQPASRGLSGARMTRDFGEIPDVTAMTKPMQRLREIADACTDELGPYSRLVGKDASNADSLEGLLALPQVLWPDSVRVRLGALRAEIRGKRTARLLSEVAGLLGTVKQALTRDRVRALARALEIEGIGMEPHVLAGAKTPGPDDTVVLFVLSAQTPERVPCAEFQTAALTLQLASAMARADGEFNAREVAHLRAEIAAWSHLSDSDRTRLGAHLDWLALDPPTVAALKKKLEPLPAESRQTIARFMATLAQADGFVSPDEVKLLERVYKLLGVDAGRVFSDIHAAAPGRASTPLSTQRAETEGFRLDRSRIEALQRDTERVSALLSTIFVEEAPPAPSPPPEAEPEALTPGSATLMGLDSANGALLRLLLSRPTWTRSELEDAAADLDLMLDGALEQINEAAFEAFDEPLIEGEDPVEINPHILEQLSA